MYPRIFLPFFSILREKCLRGRVNLLRFGIQTFSFEFYFSVLFEKIFTEEFRMKIFLQNDFSEHKNFFHFKNRLFALLKNLSDYFFLVIVENSSKESCSMRKKFVSMIWDKSCDCRKKTKRRKTQVTEAIERIQKSINH